MLLCMPVTFCDLDLADHAGLIVARDQARKIAVASLVEVPDDFA